MAAQRPSAPFPASFPGECAECGDRIDEGDMIRMLDGSAVCEPCGDQAQRDADDDLTSWVDGLV